MGCDTSNKTITNTQPIKQVNLTSELKIICDRYSDFVFSEFECGLLTQHIGNLTNSLKIYYFNIGLKY